MLATTRSVYKANRNAKKQSHKHAYNDWQPKIGKLYRRYTGCSRYRTYGKVNTAADQYAGDAEGNQTVYTDISQGTENVCGY